jgi:hypothetical protein
MPFPRYNVLYCGPLGPVPVGSKFPVRIPSSLVPQTVSIVTLSIETIIFTSFGPVLFRFIISPSRSVVTMLDHTILGPLSLSPCSYISHNIFRWKLRRFSSRRAGIKLKVLKKRYFSAVLGAWHWRLQTRPNTITVIYTSYSANWMNHKTYTGWVESK